MDFKEKRRAARIPVELKLEVSSLFKQDHEKVSDVNAPIEVLNVSKVGIGFRSASVLPLGYYFNAALHLMEEENANLYLVVKIVRIKDAHDGFREYGCEIIGFPSILSYVFDELEERFGSC